MAQQFTQQFDTSVPNIARVYDFWLGGKDNFAGSYVVITVGRGDGEVTDRFFSMYRAAARMHSHSLDQFATFFEGLEIVPPGLLLAEQWQPDLRYVRPVPKRPGEVLVGVGKVSGPG